VSKFYCASIVFTLLLPDISVAQNSPELEHTLVTGAYSPVAASELTATTDILDRDRIEALNKRSVSELLKSVPGVLVEELGGPGGLTAVSIRGGESNFTLVLLDGVAVNDPTNTRGGSFDFSRLDPASVERIEIVRGPQSAIYGSDALAGVIHIISRRGLPGHRQRLRAVAGEDNFTRYNIGASGVAGTFAYAADVSSTDSGEPVGGSTRDSRQGGVRLDWQPEAAQQFSISYRVLDGDTTSYPEQSGGPKLAVIDDLDVSDYRDQTLAASWRYEVTPTWTSELRASRFEHNEDYVSPGINPFLEVPPNAADTEFVREKVRWVNTVRFSDQYGLDAGADYRDEDGESGGYLEFSGFPLPTDFELDRSTKGLFVQVHAQPSEQLLLRGSVRYDAPEGFSNETTVNLGVHYDPSDRTRLSANWGEGFKLPSFFALGHPLVGNPDLQPETSTSWDVSSAYTASNGLLLKGTYFSNDYEDLVDFDSELFVNVNRDQVESRGAEMQLAWSAVDSLDLQAQITYTDIDVKDSSAPLLGRPQWRAGATAVWRFAPGWNTAFDYQWTGEQYASSLHTGQTVIETLDDYHRIDWNIRWLMSQHIAVELALENILDEKYRSAVGFPSPGRAARLGFTWGNSSGN
jgi:iron complex outermembrane receptor protein/vitamin B12 transporter